jgi:hypothetical protein
MQNKSSVFPLRKRPFLSVCWALIVFPALLIWSCDGPYEDCPEHRFTDDFKSHVLFNPGSYWIYEDTALHLTDSVYLKTQEFFFDAICDMHGEPEDILDQDFSLTRNGSTTEFPVFTSGMEMQYGSWGGPGYYSDNCAMTTDVSCTALDSVEVNGIWYSHISIFTEGDNATFWSRNTGAIKRQFPKSGSDTLYHFDLVRYHLE